MDTPLKFLLFYTAFILFVTFISVQAGVTIFSDVEGFDDITETDAIAENYLNPWWYLGVLTAMFTISTEFTLLYITILAPFIVGLAFIIVEKIIDIIPL
jgi:hypothetical protein